MTEDGYTPPSGPYMSGVERRDWTPVPVSRQYHKALSDRMFDFKEFYLATAMLLPANARIAEVGVADGASAIFLAEEMLNLGKDEFTLHLVDNLAYGGAEQLNELLYHLTQAELMQYVRVHPFSSLDASCKFPDHYFDLVFIDASHQYEPTKADIRLWYRKVKDLGILAGHDYNEEEGAEVKQAVDEVIPITVTLPEPVDGELVEEDVLQMEFTEKGFGLWWLEKKHYVKMK